MHAKKWVFIVVVISTRHSDNLVESLKRLNEQRSTSHQKYLQNPRSPSANITRTPVDLNTYHLPNTATTNTVPQNSTR
ncbi:unnamed protein product [Rotaria magnacalcarata]